MLCYVKADGTENCTDPYLTPSVSTISFNHGIISATLCCEDPNHQVFKSDWCEGSAGKEEQIDICYQKQMIKNLQKCLDDINEMSQTSNSDNDVNDTESLSVAEGNDSNTTCTGESGAPYDADAYKILEVITPTICNKESGLCASCEVGVGNWVTDGSKGPCSCSGTCADGSTLPKLRCSTSEWSYEYEDCNNEDPGLCTSTTTKGPFEDHKLTADGVDYYFSTRKSCSGNSSGTMSSSSSFVMLLLSVAITRVVGI